MRVKHGKEKDWDECVLANREDNYSRECLEFAVRWTNLMEAYIDNTDMSVEMVLKEKANRLSLDANYDGINGFQFDCAVRVLLEFWEYAGQLRAWHNGRYVHPQVGLGLRSWLYE